MDRGSSVMTSPPLDTEKMNPTELRRSSVALELENVDLTDETSSTGEPQRRRHRCRCSTHVSQSTSTDDLPTVAADEKNCSLLGELTLERFCRSSTIHGTYYIAEAKGPYAKAFWGCILTVSILCAGGTIFYSMQSWNSSPSTTSVKQIAIEQVQFPAITICPIDNTRYGPVEDLMNSMGDSNHFNTRDVVVEILKNHMNLRSSTDSKVPHDDCLVKKCLTHQEKLYNKTKDTTDCHSECVGSKLFEKFVEQAHECTDESYKKWMERLLSTDGVTLEAKLSSPSNETDCRKAATGGKLSKDDRCDLTPCAKQAKDFRILLKVDEVMSGNLTSLRKGTIFKTLLTQLDQLSTNRGQDGRKGDIDAVFESFANSTSFNQLYQNYWMRGKVIEETNPVPLPHLSRKLNTNKDFTSYEDFGASEGDLPIERFKILDREFYQMARRSSTHNPHVKRLDTGLMSAPTFPFCKYPTNETSKNDFCRAFQTTFNDRGVCYTFNNIRQPLDTHFSHGESPIKVRQVAGCGKENGLQLVIDAHKLTSMHPKSTKERKGYRVFVTRPGTVSSKTVYHVDPKYRGEHNFYIHGIHVVKASDEFREWNKHALQCYPSNYKNLTYFREYTQDSCLLECKMNKIARKCQCTPWYMVAAMPPGDNQTFEGSICGTSGNRCFDAELRGYFEEHNDIEECDCKGDCEMVHFFTTLQREPFSTNDGGSQHWFNPRLKSGLLADYLLDPNNVFQDPLTRNITKLTHGLTNDQELAVKRFEEDVAVVNFFFDTPIITEIQLELKTNQYAKLANVGGTLGLFSGVSLISGVELAGWTLLIMFRGLVLKCFTWVRRICTFRRRGAVASAEIDLSDNTLQGCKVLP